MMNTTKTWVFGLLLALLSLPLSAEEAVSGLIIKLDRGQAGERVAINRARVDTLSRAAGVALRHGRTLAIEAELFRLPRAVPMAKAREISERLSRLPGVLYAEPDRRLYPLLTPNDEHYASYQWNLQARSVANPGGANLSAAWDVSTGNAALVVAVVDTGILNHADLAPARFAAGYDFVSYDPVYGDLFDGDGTPGRDADPSDPGDWVAADSDPVLVSLNCPEVVSSWHGSHVAGTIAASTNNGTGVAGVTWQGRVLPIRALGKCGGLTSDIVEGMLWAGGLAVPGVPANANPAQVINLSLGGTGLCSTTEQSAINALRAAGVTVVVAAGNENQDASNSAPANCDGVIAVAAHGKDGQRASYSNYGARVDISAPGGDRSKDTGIAAPINESLREPTGADVYGLYQGTSMAAPHVAGIALLMQAAHSAAGYPNNPLTPDQLEREIQLSAAAFPASSDCAQRLCGAGLIDAAAALGRVNGAVAPVAKALVANAANSIYATGITVPAGASILLDGSGSSDDGNSLSYSWQQAPSDAVPVTISNASNVSASFIAPGVDSVVNLTLTVSDGQSLFDTAQVSVAVGNSPPVLQAIGDRRVAQDASLSFTISASDDPGDSLSFSATGLPVDASLVDNGNGTALFSWPSADFSITQTHVVTFTVTDSGGLSDSESISISLDNFAPVLQSIGGKTGLGGMPLSFQVIATDADGDVPILSASGLPSGASFTDNGNGIGSFNWPSPVPGSYIVTFIATDALHSGLQDSESVILSIGAAPVISNGGGGGGGAFGLWLFLLPLLRRYLRPRA